MSMLLQTQERWGIRINVTDPAQAAQWLEANLFFSIEPSGVGFTAVNGNCLLELLPGPSEALPKPAAGTYFAGLAHIALRTRDIEEAIAWCQSRGLELQLDQGRRFYNPKVYGEGEYFFNIISPFGVVFEVSQRLAEPTPWPDPVICGLDHIGLPSADFAAAAAAFENLGFAADFAPVENWNASEGRIRCGMFSQSDPAGQTMTLEIYQFLDWSAEAIPASYGIKGLVLGRSGTTATGVALY